MHVVEEFRSSSANDTASSSPGSMNAARLARGRAPYERQQENALPPGLLCILNCPATSTGSVLNLGASNCCFKLNAIKFIISQHIPGLFKLPSVLLFIFIIKCNFAQYVPAFGSLYYFTIRQTRKRQAKTKESTSLQQAGDLQPYRRLRFSTSSSSNMPRPPRFGPCTPECPLLYQTEPSTFLRQWKMRVLASSDPRLARRRPYIPDEAASEDQIR